MMYKAISEQNLGQWKASMLKISITPVQIKMFSHEKNPEMSEEQSTCNPISRGVVPWSNFLEQNNRIQKLFKAL